MNMKSKFNNKFQIAGTIIKVIESPAKGSKPASAVLLVQYGPKREPTGKEVEFINAVLVRIPSYRYERIAAKCKEGAYCEVEGHMQGVVKGAFDGNRVYVELVSDNVYIHSKAQGEDGAGESTEG